MKNINYKAPKYNRETQETDVVSKSYPCYTQEEIDYWLPIIINNYGIYGTVTQTNLEPSITWLKLQLELTDYKAIKYAEGILSEEDYLPFKTQRQEWRDKITELGG